MAISGALVARFPFVSAARALLSGVSEVGFEQLERAKSRATFSVALAMRKAEFDLQSSIGSAREEVEALATARLLVGLIDSDYYLAAFAKGEAKTAKLRLSTLTQEEFLVVFSDFFPSCRFETQGEEEGFAVSLSDFLSSGEDLPTKSVRAGEVKLSRKEALSLFENAVFLKLRRRLSPAEIPTLFRQASAELALLLPQPTFKSDYSGKYLSLPCIEWILKGVPEGKRYYASVALSVACKKDGLQKSDALKAMQQFVENCGISPHPFTIREGQATLDWVYKRNPRFSCRFHRQHGLGPEGAGYPCDQAMRKQGGKASEKNSAKES